MMEENKGWICPICGRGNSPYVVSCPCYEIDTIQIITLPVIEDLNPIPAPCRECSNHTLNGGSGICHCILGDQTTYTCETGGVP